MITVLTYGTFDLFHVGHVRLLKRLKDLGDRLIVGCSTDEFNLQKGKRSVFTYCDRVEILMSCRYVDVVIPEKTWSQKSTDIKLFNVNIFAIGNDWEGHFDYLSEETGCAVRYLERTKGISTSDIKNTLY